jgi:hypothetical protein
LKSAHADPAEAPKVAEIGTLAIVAAAELSKLIDTVNVAALDQVLLLNLI